MKTKKPISAFLLLCFLLSALAACSPTAQQPPESEAGTGSLREAEVEYLTSPEFYSTRSRTETNAEFRAGAADFALDLLRCSDEYDEGSGLLVSPLSVMLALAMTANGAEGETLTQMEALLADGMTIDRLNQDLYSYASYLTLDSNASLRIANSVWFTSDSRFTVNPKFINTVENTFDADIIRADLTDPAVFNAVNKWVNDKTLGMIDRILNEGDLNESSIMVLLNALAFEAVWVDQVLDKACFEDKFNGNQTATFMNTECNSYIEGERETGIIKNYRGGRFAFMALLPNEGINIKDYMNSLDGETYLELYDSRIKAEGNISVSAKIPHFSFDCSLNLNEVLQGLGMSRAFTGAAEFGGLGESTSGSIFIGKVLHKTHISLDNSGTRAASVTAVITYDGIAPTIIKEYRVELDRPFVYAIIDTKLGLPVFIGSCESLEG